MTNEKMRMSLAGIILSGVQHEALTECCAPLRIAQNGTQTQIAIVPTLAPPQT